MSYFEIIINCIIAFGALATAGTERDSKTD